MTNTPDDVEVIEKRADFQGYFRIDTYRLRHRLHDGRWSKEVTREVFERGHAVAVIPYDPALDRVVLIEQFRIGAYAARQSRWFADDVSPWLIEVIAGIIEPGEDPAEVAVRETVEECGLNLSELIPVSHYLASPGGTSRPSSPDVITSGIPPTPVDTPGQPNHIASRRLRQKLSVSELKSARSAACR